MNPQYIEGEPSGINWTHLQGYRAHTSNPIRGCLHKCKYKMPGGVAQCYAKTQAELRVKHYPNGFEHISFHPEQLAEWRSKRKPCAIFCDSMSDMFGVQVPAEHINAIIQTALECPQHIIMSLTKNPARLKEFTFPDNWWVGISSPPDFMFDKELTLKQQNTWFKKALGFLSEVKAGVRFLSVEPLSWDCTELLAQNKDAYDWIILGPATDGNNKVYQPDEQLFARAIKAVEGKPLLFKDTLDRALAERHGGWRNDFPPFPQQFAQPDQESDLRDKLEVSAGDTKRKEELAALERVIEKGLQPFWQTGVALAKIRSQKLWAPKYKSWPKYLEQRWGFRGPRASQLIGSGRVVDLITMVNKSPAPKSERVVRPLVPLLNVPAADLKGLSDEEVAKVIAEREAFVVRIYAAATQASGKKVPTGKDVEKQVQLLAPEQKSKSQAEPETLKLVVEPRIRERFDKHWAMFWHLLADEDPEVIWDLIAEQEGNAVPSRPVRTTTAEDASESTAPTGIDTPSLEVAHEIATEVVAPDGVAGPGTVPEPPAVPVSAKPEQEEVQPAAWEQMDLIVTHPSVKPEAVAEKPEVVPQPPIRSFAEFKASRKNKTRQRNIRVRRAA